MKISKEIGKIRSIRLGMGGYQDAMFGVTFDLGGKSWGVGDFWGTWAHWDKHCKWTVEDQIKQFGATMAKLRDLITKAKVNSINELKNVPVEVIFEDQCMKSWRILEEVL